MHQRYYFKINNKDSLIGQISLHAWTLGEQDIIIKLNGYEVYRKKILSNNRRIEFNFNTNLLKERGMNRLTFKFPNAHKPNNRDTRVLAMALKSFSIEYRRAILPHETLGTPVAKYSFTYGANWISPSTPHGFLIKTLLA